MLWMCHCLQQNHRCKFVLPIALFVVVVVVFVSIVPQDYRYFVVLVVVVPDFVVFVAATDSYWNRCDHVHTIVRRQHVVDVAKQIVRLFVSMHQQILAVIESIVVLVVAVMIQVVVILVVVDRRVERVQNHPLGTTVR